MNSCVLMAEIVSEPQLRYTSDNQVPIAEIQVEFPGFRPEDPPARLKVVGWGNLAQEIQDRYHQGDRVIIEGRLSIVTIERPEGFKEKRAELTAQKIHPLGADAGTYTVAAASAEMPDPAAETTPKPKASVVSESKARPAVKKSAAPVVSASEANYDDIPF
ncbi:single-stranded DNA-binding protein [Leptolyngbya sp. 'hensonii']|uniref:single-stranded DNA-binding protein n=1 Tax=Leptolyngbya sp. 'hensonii' TaxID=1922337 RepID=UPI00095006A3|nr:single-stranded DNA-binding protein [Leptolyngbya sp. 'hensonii']OLP17918.1 single-stranded DNA-binding protein [Leptolyngbya sp. 'hensonii']